MSRLKNWVDEPAAYLPADVKSGWRDRVRMPKCSTRAPEAVPPLSAGPSSRPSPAAWRVRGANARAIRAGPTAGARIRLLR